MRTKEELKGLVLRCFEERLKVGNQLVMEVGKVKEEKREGNILMVEIPIRVVLVEKEEVSGCWSLVSYLDWYKEAIFGDGRKWERLPEFLHGWEMLKVKEKEDATRLAQLAVSVKWGYEA